MPSTSALEGTVVVVQDEAKPRAGLNLHFPKQAQPYSLLQR